MAIAYEHSKARFNTKDHKLFDHHIYVFCGDGCLMEGITSEASSVAGHLGLSSLIVIYDDNKITIDGHTDIAFTEDVGKRYESYGWNVLYVKNGDTDTDAIEKALKSAKSQSDKPSIIILKTTIGFGSKNQGKHSVHGAPLGDEDIAKLKEKFGFNPNEKFFVDEKVAKYYGKVIEENNAKEEKWNELYADWAKHNEKLAKEHQDLKNDKFDTNWESQLTTYTPKDKPMATRKLSQLTLNKFATLDKNLIGGSADLAASNLTDITGEKDFQKTSYEGRNIRFGVREHAMAAIANGIRAHSNYVPFVATFLNFMGYMIGAVRLSAISKFQVIYIMTHDSIGLGEDGPTHQPIETLSMLRSTPNINVFRPCDGNEVNGCYISALKSKETPSVISLTRQDLPQLEGSDAKKVELGGYVLQDSQGKPDVILVATGSEVSICVSAAKLLTDLKVRIVSFPSLELFEKQSLDYRKSVLLEDVPILSVEALSTFGWSRYSHAQIGMKSFGKSAPFEKLYEHFGFTPKNISEKASKLVSYYKDKKVPNIFDSINFEL